MPSAFPDSDALEAQFIAFFAKSMGNVFAQFAELSKGLRDDEGDEFAAGLRDVLHSVIDDTIRADAQEAEVGVAVQAFVDYIKGWVMTSRLDASEEWHKQMDGSAERLRSGDLGTPVAASAL